MSKVIFGPNTLLLSDLPQLFILYLSKFASYVRFLICFYLHLSSGICLHILQSAFFIAFLEFFCFPIELFFLLYLNLCLTMYSKTVQFNLLQKNMHSISFDVTIVSTSPTKYNGYFICIICFNKIADTTNHQKLCTVISLINTYEASSTYLAKLASN